MTGVPAPCWATSDACGRGIHGSNTNGDATVRKDSDSPSRGAVWTGQLVGRGIHGCHRNRDAAVRKYSDSPSRRGLDWNARADRGAQPGVNTSERSAAHTYKSRPMERERYFQPFPLELHSCCLLQLPFNTLYSSRKRIPDIAPTHTMYNGKSQQPSLSAICTFLIRYRMPL